VDAQRLLARPSSGKVDDPLCRREPRNRDAELAVWSALHAQARRGCPREPDPGRRSRRPSQAGLLRSIAGAEHAVFHVHVGERGSCPAARAGFVRARSGQWGCSAVPPAPPRRWPRRRSGRRSVPSTRHPSPASPRTPGSGTRRASARRRTPHVAARGENTASATARKAAARGHTGARLRPPRGARRTVLPSDGAHRTATHAGATAGPLRSTDDAASPLRDRCNARTRRATVNQTRESRTFSAAKPRT
jgi:hypothetical protein